MFQLPPDLYEVERRVANFHDGSKPSWVTESTTGGASISYTNASDSFGFATLSTGTNSTGDLAELKSNNEYDADAYGAIEMAVEWKASTGDSSLIDSRPIDMLSGNSDEFRYLAAVPSLSVNGVQADQISGDINNTVRHQSRIVWYVDREVMRLYVDGQKQAELTGSSNLPPTTEEYAPRALVVTDDTGADRTMDIYRIEVAGYIDAKTR